MLFGAFNIASSGMTAQRLRMDVISENIANVQTTRTENGGAYVRKNVVFAEKGTTYNIRTFSDIYDATRNGVGNGVKATAIVEDTDTPMELVYDPSHPDADENGYVTYPNVNIVTEMTDLIDASRSYEASSTAFEAAKSIAAKGLQIGQ